MIEWQKIYCEIEDDLIPHLRMDVWEKSLYYFLLRKTRLVGQEKTTIPLSAIKEAIGCSEWQSRKSIRSLAKKGCLELKQTRHGHCVKVHLPHELTFPPTSPEKEQINIEEIDFFKNRIYLGPIIRREKNRCFYCLRDISADSCELDHVVSQLEGGGNGYRNIVASCHICNTKKQGQGASDFFRKLYRMGLLNEDEFEERKSTLGKLVGGQLVPDINRL